MLPGKSNYYIAPDQIRLFPIFGLLIEPLMILFLHIEKTAGTSFKTLLRANFGIGVVESNKIK